MKLRYAYVVVVATAIGSGAVMGSEPRYIGMHADQGASDAVVVRDAALAHTTQCLSTSVTGELIGRGDAVAQTKQVLENVAASLAAAGSGLDETVKLNVYVADETVAAKVRAILAARFAGDRKPAVSFVVTRLPLDGAVVAIDAVAIAKEAKPSVRLQDSQSLQRTTGAHVSILPVGSHIYVSGQAEKGASLAEATRNTLESLRRTIRFLGRRDSDIVQLKAFLSPMSDVGVVQSEIATFFGEGRVAPLSYVEWTSPLIEIELIAWGGEHNAGPAVEYVTPPGMSASPVFSRVARIHSAPTIYISGLYAENTADEDTETRDVFHRLTRVLEDSGSSLRYLAKATYYCATDEISRKLTELRPNYYDAPRPPAASKAMVAGVAKSPNRLTLDMIAVPAWDNVDAEYGPAEFGHGLTREDARAGWLSLYDGQTSFGWVDGTIDNGGLSAGKTTMVFGPSQIRVEVSQPGTFSLGADPRNLMVGSHTIELRAPASIQLNDAIRVRSLVLRPVGLEPIFNGSDTAGWRRVDRETIPDSARPKWQVVDNRLQAQGGPGAFEYIARQFGDFALQLDSKTTRRHANSGVFFRSIPGDYMNGYEAQIYHRANDGNPARPARFSTGAIHDRQSAKRLVSRDGEWTTMTIMARGPHLATWVNGAQMNDVTDTRSAHDNPREGLRTAAGTIQLQAHDAGTVIEFANIGVAAW